MTRREIIAAAIANARGGRRGAPPIANILEVLECARPNLLEEVLDDAAAVERALAEADGRGVAPKAGHAHVMGATDDVFDRVEPREET